MALPKKIKLINVATASFPVAVNLASDVQHYKIYGTKTLSTNIAITASGTPAAGMDVIFDYTAAITTTSNTLTIFGTVIPKGLYNTKCIFWCKYNDGAWVVMMLMNVEKLFDNSGVIIVGTGGIVPIDSSAAGAIVIGSGTGFAAYTLSGDVTMTAGGAVTIGANKILSAMVKAGELTNAHLNAAAAIDLTKLAATTASKILVSDGSGVIAPSAVASSKLSALDVTTAGTLEASKALIVDSSKKINELDITALKLNGTTLTATASELNGMQAQIDAGIALVTHTTLTVDHVATAATLKSSYVAETTSVGSVELTLPQGSTLPIGTQVRLLRVGGNAATIKPYAGDTMYPVTSVSSGSATLSCSGTGKSLTVILTSANTWQCIQLD